MGWITTFSKTLLLLYKTSRNASSPPSFLPNDILPAAPPHPSIQPANKQTNQTPTQPAPSRKRRLSTKLSFTLFQPLTLDKYSKSTSWIPPPSPPPLHLFLSLSLNQLDPSDRSLTMRPLLTSLLLASCSSVLALPFRTLLPTFAPPRQDPTRMFFRANYTISIPHCSASLDEGATRFGGLKGEDEIFGVGGCGGMGRERVEVDLCGSERWSEEWEFEVSSADRRRGLGEWRCREGKDVGLFLS